MIDFIKLNITHISETKLINNPAIRWTQISEPDTGELLRYVGQYYNLEIVITTKQKILSGSLHQLKNELRTQTRNNYDDFSHGDLIGMIQHLKSELGVNPKKANIQNLEYGVNVKMWKSPTAFIQENVIVYDGKPYSSNPEYGRHGKFYQFTKSHKRIKIYDKGSQHDLREWILRFEIKAKKNDRLPDSVVVLNDLSRSNVLQELKQDLLKEYDRLLIVDDLFKPKDLTLRESEAWDKGTNPKIWESLSKGYERARLKKRINHLLHKYGKDTYHQALRDRISSKWDTLEKCNDLTSFEKPAIKPTIKMDIIYKSQNIAHSEKRTCIATGIPIDGQIPSSRFIRESTLTKIYRSDPGLFNELCVKYLDKPNGREAKTINKLVYYIAKNIRSRHRKKRLQVIYKTEKYKWSLFPLAPDEYIHYRVSI